MLCPFLCNVAGAIKTIQPHYKLGTDGKCCEISRSPQRVSLNLPSPHPNSSFLAKCSVSSLSGKGVAIINAIAFIEHGKTFRTWRKVGGLGGGNEGNPELVVWLVNRDGLNLILAYWATRSWGRYRVLLVLSGCRFPSGEERNGRYGFRRGDSRWLCCFDLSFHY